MLADVAYQSPRRERLWPQGQGHSQLIDRHLITLQRLRRVLLAKMPFLVTSPDFNHWEDEIEAFEQADRRHPPPKDAVLFLGSSTIRLWKTLSQDFLDYPVLNRGFGGSNISDAAHFAERIVFPYEPRAIFFRSGGNDIAAGKSPDQVLAEFKAFAEKIHASLPTVEIAVISLAASLLRWETAGQNKAVSKQIEEYTRGKPYLTFIDTYDLSLGQDGRPRPELFADDLLHYNAPGYRLLAECVRPYLPKR